MLNEAEKLALKYEELELEAPTGCASTTTYAHLLIVYLYQNDMCNARFLWKRIPPSVKTKSPELSQIWLVGQKMWLRDWPAVYVALNHEWSQDISPLISALTESVRDRAWFLISNAYSSVDLSVVAAMTGLSPEQARQSAQERGWSLDETTVRPCKIDKEQFEPQTATARCITEDQLYKLTQFVSFLEN